MQLATRSLPFLLENASTGPTVEPLSTCIFHSTCARRSRRSIASVLVNYIDATDCIHQVEANAILRRLTGKHCYRATYLCAGRGCPVSPNADAALPYKVYSCAITVAV